MRGIDKFKERFAGHDGEYVLIGGGACDLLFGEAGQDFRVTKDLDLVLLVEALTPESGLMPIHIDDEASSLSAILLDEEYYRLLVENRTSANGVAVLSVEGLIPFKAKAWLDLSARRAGCQAVDEKSVKKHRNDVCRLATLLAGGERPAMSEGVRADMRRFLEAYESDPVDPKALKFKDVGAQQMRALIRPSHHQRSPNAVGRLPLKQRRGDALGQRRNHCRRYRLNGFDNERNALLGCQILGLRPDRVIPHLVEVVGPLPCEPANTEEDGVVRIAHNTR